MKRLLTLLICVVIGTTGCLTNINNEKNEMSTIASLYSLLKESKNGDGKSVYWDGKEATISEDNLDLDNILDGRSVSEGIEKYTADKLIECNYPIGFKQVDIDESHPDCCHFINGKDEILVNRVNYVEEVAHIDEDENYMEIDFMGIRENRIKYFKNYKTYLGISELSGEKKAGFILVFESELADRSYKIEVYGIGNMSELKSEALVIMNGFDVLFYSNSLQEKEIDKAEYETNKQMIVNELKLEANGKKIDIIMKRYYELENGLIQELSSGKEGVDEYLYILTESGNEYRFYLSGTGVDSIYDITNNDWPVKSIM